MEVNFVFRGERKLGRGWDEITMSSLEKWTRCYGPKGDSLRCVFLPFSVFGRRKPRWVRVDVWTARQLRAGMERQADALNCLLVCSRESQCLLFFSRGSPRACQPARELTTQSNERARGMGNKRNSRKGGGWKGERDA